MTDAKGRPLKFFMTAGQVSDYTLGAAPLSCLPKAEWLHADRRYDDDWFRDALKDMGIKPCISPLSRPFRSSWLRYRIKKLCHWLPSGGQRSSKTNSVKTKHALHPCASRRFIAPE